MFSQFPVSPDPEPCNELHRRRPSQEVYHRLRHERETRVLARKTLSCDEPDEIVEFFRQFRPFKVVVEATASYLWFVESRWSPWPRRSCWPTPRSSG